MSEQLKEILQNKDLSEDDITHWIRKNIEQESVLIDLIECIDQYPEYSHFFVSYCAESLRKWNYISPKAVTRLVQITAQLSTFSAKNTHFVHFFEDIQSSSLLLY